MVSSDETRKGLLGIDTRERHYDAFDHGVYAPSITERTYATMVDRAEALLIAGQSVILDGCFTKRSQRARAVALATRMEVPLLMLDCQLPGGPHPPAPAAPRVTILGSLRRALGDLPEAGRQLRARRRDPCRASKIELDRSRPVEVLVEELLARVPAAWYDAASTNGTAS